MRLLRLLTLTLVFMATSILEVRFAHAEYRAYRLAIVDSKTGVKRTVVSILDDQQYPTYHHVKRDEQISIEAHWRCRERSDISQDPLQKICPQPNGQNAR